MCLLCSVSSVAQPRSVEIPDIYLTLRGKVFRLAVAEFAEGGYGAVRRVYVQGMGGASEDRGGQQGFSSSRSGAVSTSNAAGPSSATAVAMKTQIKDGANPPGATATWGQRCL